MVRRDTWWETVRSERAAVAAFVAYLVVAAPVLVFVAADRRWFFLDEWAFFARDLGTLEGFLEPHNGHWVTAPVLGFRALEAVVGLDSYRPYLAMVVASHLAVVALLRAVLRRAGTGPWLATAVASALVLFGPGGDDITWAFQISFTGAVGFGFAQFLLADRDGPLGRRDGLALGAGLLALASGGVAVAMVLATGAALLVRRGWRRAVLQVVPLVTAYLVWYLAYDASDAVDVPSPTAGRVVEWVWNAVASTFVGLGNHRAVAVVLAAGLVGGLLLAVVARRPPPDADEPGRSGPVAAWHRVRRRLVGVAVPVAYVGGALVFALLTARSRWFFGADAARSPRYVYVYAALTLPAIGIAGQAIIDRWRRAAPVVALAVLVAVPANARPSAFVDPFGDDFFASQRRALTTIVRLPEARRVPRDVQPIRVTAGPHAASVGVLLDAVDDGRLTPSTGPIPPLERGALLVRLGVALRTAEDAGATCEKPVPPTPTVHPVGTRFTFTGGVVVRLIGPDGAPASPPQVFDAAGGDELTVELSDLRVTVKPLAGGTVRRCAPAV